VATRTYVIHPAQRQVWGGNCAIFEVSLGSCLISSVASRQLSQPGHAPQRRDRKTCHGAAVAQGSGGMGRGGTGQWWHGMVVAQGGQGQPASPLGLQRGGRAPTAPRDACAGGCSGCPRDGGRWLRDGIAAQGGENDAAWGQRELPRPQHLRKASRFAGGGKK